jgi:hypothetical protein
LSIVSKGLIPKQIMDNILEAVKNTGIEKDERFILKTESSNELLKISLQLINIDK